MHPGPPRRAWLAPAALLCLLVPSTASGALRFGACPGEVVGGECARLNVPLDRTGATPGTVSLLIRRVSTGRRPSSRVLVGIAGGPGQSAIAAFGEGSGAVLGPLLDDRDFVQVDVRGTGGSDPLRCPGLDRARQGRRAAEGGICARRLGARRSFYTTRDNVADLEAVRTALGVPKLSLYGVSYGTKLALAYAQAHPTRVERMLLDSVLPPEGPDPLYRPSFQALRRVLPALCARGACRGVTRDPYGDLAELAARLRRAPLAGRVVGLDGRARPATADESELFTVLLAGDQLPFLRSYVPAAVRSALDGDPAALLRLTDPDVAQRGAREAAVRPVAFSEALYAATSCEEMAFPWSRSSPISSRAAELRAALDAVPPSSFAPFGRAVPPTTDFLRVCSRWPVRPEAPVLAGTAFPDVPALLLVGEDDLRTPLEQARLAASRLPGAELMSVQATGHSVGSGDPPRCVRNAIARWTRGKPVPDRCKRRRTDPIAAVTPAHLADTPAVRGTSGRAGRTLGAVVLSLADVAAARATLANRGGGLRSGFFVVRGDTLRLTGYSVVPGVAVSGVIGRTTGTLRVSGRAAAPGTLSVARDGTLSGRLGGVAVSTPRSQKR